MHESQKLQGIGCNVGQGYLFAKPMPRGDLIALMRQRMVGRPRPAVKMSRRLLARTCICRILSRLPQP